MTRLVDPVTVVQGGCPDGGVEVAGDRRGEAGEAQIQANHELLASVEVGDLHYADTVLRAVRVSRFTKDRTGRLVEFLDQCRGLRAVEADVAALAALTGQREVHAADADLDDVRIADTGLSVVLGVEVVLDEDRLVVVAASVDPDLRKKDDSIVALEVLGLQLFHDIVVDGPVIVRKVVRLNRSDLLALVGTARVVGYVGTLVGGSGVVERKVPGSCEPGQATAHGHEP